MTVIERMQKVVAGMANEEEDAVLAGIQRITELEAGIRAALEMVDGNGVPPNWDWMRALLADDTATYYARQKD